MKKIIIIFSIVLVIATGIYLYSRWSRDDDPWVLLTDGLPGMKVYYMKGTVATFEDGKRSVALGFLFDKNKVNERGVSYNAAEMGFIVNCETRKSSPYYSKTYRKEQNHTIYLEKAVIGVEDDLKDEGVSDGAGRIAVNVLCK